MSFGSALNTEPQDYAGVIFQGVVVDDNDPEKLERVRVSVKGLYEGAVDTIPWALPYKDRLFGSKAGQGTFCVPRNGTRLHVILQQGSIQHPMYTASFMVNGTQHATFETNYPNRYGFVDPAGNIWYVDTTPGQVDVMFTHKSGTTFHIADNGAVTVSTPSTMSLNSVGSMTLHSDTHIGLTAPRIDWN